MFAEDNATVAIFKNPKVKPLCI